MPMESTHGPLGPDYANVAFHTLHQAIAISTNTPPLPPPTPIFTSTQSDLSTPSPPLFCTFTAKRRGDGEYDLRGCIGTLSKPRNKTLSEVISDYAIIAGQQDSRFDPVTTLEELMTMRCCISLLTEEVPVERWDDWTPGVHGTTIDFVGDGARGRFSATYLPEVAAEMGWGKLETMSSLVSKAGYRGRGANSTMGGYRDFTIDERWIREHQLSVRTYESKKSGPVTYEEFVASCS